MVYKQETEVRCGVHARDRIVLWCTNNRQKRAVVYKQETCVVVYKQETEVCCVVYATEKRVSVYRQ